MKKSYFKLLPYCTWIIFLILAPTLIVFSFAFLNEDFRLTFENFKRISNYLKIISKSLVFTTIATTLCLLIAYPVSYFASKIKSELYKKIFIVIITLPIWTNLLLRTYSWMTILENNGLLNRFLIFLKLKPIHIINTPVAIIIVMAYDFLPFMILPIYTTICKINKNLIQASEDLGANTFQTFRYILLPLSAPGILSGVSIVFVSCACSFLIPRLLGGGSNVLIGELIESQFMGTIYNPWFGSALSIFFMLLIGVIIYTTNNLNKTETENLPIWLKKLFLK